MAGKERQKDGKRKEKGREEKNTYKQRNIEKEQIV